MKNHRCRGCGFALLPHVKGPWCLICAPLERPRLRFWSRENLAGLWDELLTAATFVLVVIALALAIHGL